MKSFTLVICLALSIYGYSQQNLKTKQFPQITLSNSIQYSDTSFADLPGNGFLIDIGDEILAVTCKHALWLNRSKEMKTINFEGKLKEWEMVVLNDPSQYVILGDLINANSAEVIGERNTDRDFLVFKIKENHSKIVPLKLSAKPVQTGDTIYQDGWTYKIKKSNPQSFAAIAKGYSGSSLFMNSVIPQNNAGLSGSPVINKKNELVAIVSSWKVDMATNKWYEAPCSTDYLWSVLYSYWLDTNKKQKSIKTFQEFITKYQTPNGIKPEISSYLYTELFYSDYLKSKNLKYGSLERFIQWTDGLMKSFGIKVTADNYRKSLLVFDGWKDDYAKGNKDTKNLEQMLGDANVPVPNYMDFCDFAQELSASGKHDKSISLLLFADDKIQHMGQLYAFLGDAYLAKGDKVLAKESYLKCLKTYPEYPQATDGLKRLQGN